VILAGDIGGTKTTLALFDGARDVREQTFHSADHPSLEAIVAAFAPGPVVAACFGVAGPVEGGAAKITNLPWQMSEQSLSAALGGAPVALINDLQATALGMLALPPEKFAVLQAGKSVDRDTIAVIAPGTGLGEGTLVWADGAYRALPSEAGHADWAPGTDEELRLWQFLHGKYGHVSCERVLCGSGISDLFDFARGGGPDPDWLAKDLAGGMDRNASISTAGLARLDPSAARALELFAELLGAECGNIALRSLALGGVIIGGGVPPKILPALQTGALLRRFTDKGRFAGWASERFVRVALEPRAALLGAAAHAALKGNP
jgi:glucokinase